ncbi:hypothetical protein ABW19_dt0208896 [Dactylella cylindrospora]|nr:hypothetical protein ABW19_dt0208896 [Dactylella cylindrospora]
MASWFTRLATFLFLLGPVLASPTYPKPTSVCQKPSTVTLTRDKTCTVYIHTTKIKETVRYTTIKVPHTIKIPIVKWQKTTITVTSPSTVTQTVPSLLVSGSVSTVTESFTESLTESFTESFTESLTESRTESFTESFTETLTESFTESFTTTEVSISATTEISVTTEVSLSTETSVSTEITTVVSTEVSTEVSSTTVTETYTPTCDPATTPYLRDDSFATSTTASGFYNFWTVAKATLTAPDAFQTGPPSSNNVFQYVGTHPSGYGANGDFTSLQVIVFGNQIVKVSQKITLCAGQSYRLSAYWNYAGGSDACSAEICFDGESCSSGGRYTSASNFPRSPVTDRYGWLLYSSTFTPTGSGEVEVQFKFKCEGTAVTQGNRLYLDHATFSLVGSP